MKIRRKELTGKDIIEKCEIRSFELQRWVRMGLTPYSKATEKPYYLNPLPSFSSFEFDPNKDHTLPDWKFLYPYIENCLFRRDELVEFIKDHGLYYLYPKLGIPDEKERQFLPPKLKEACERDIREGLYKNEEEWIEALGPETRNELLRKDEPETETINDVEDFIKNLKVSYENYSEIKIQERGRSPVTYNCKMLGFRDETTEEWKTFLNILQEPNFTYNVGKAYTYSQDGSGFIKKRNEFYDRKQRRLKRINIKLINFFNKNYPLQIPRDFKLYERCVSDKPGTYRFKFQVLDEDANKIEILNTAKVWPKDKLLDEIEKHHSMLGQPDCDEPEILKKLQNLIDIAKEKGISEDEIMYRVKDEKEEYKYDQDKNIGDLGPNY